MSRAERLVPISDALDEDVADRLPARHELDFRHRVLTETSAAFDVALRTLAASLVTAAAIPAALSPATVRADRQALERYAQLAAARDPARTFPAPVGDVEVRATPVTWLRRPRLRGRVDTLTFESRYEALDPELRERYGGHRNNRVAHAQHWRHRDGPRPTLAVIHGFMASPPVVNSAFFSLPWFYAQGYDVLLYTLPFHGRRQDRCSPFSGAGLFSNGVTTICEAVPQAVHDFRVFVDHLERQGVDQIGLTGLSLGGYHTALLAAVEPRLKVVVPNAAVTDLAGLIAGWIPAGPLLRTMLPRYGVDWELFAGAMAAHSPLTYDPVVPFDRRLIIAGLGDRLAPPEQSEALWEHWDRCALHWFPGNHVLHVNRVRYLRKMRSFFRVAGFA